MKPIFSALLTLALTALMASIPGYAGVFLDEPGDNPETLPGSSMPEEDSGVPIFRFNDNSWFELTIPDTAHPETGMDIEAERNRDNAIQNSDRQPLFDENLDFLNQLQLRYRIKFK